MGARQRADAGQPRHRVARSRQIGRLGIAPLGRGGDINPISVTVRQPFLMGSVPDWGKTSGLRIKPVGLDGADPAQPINNAKRHALTVFSFGYVYATAKLVD